MLNWRLELEGNANQTETVYPQLFRTRKAALDYAERVLKHWAKKWGVGAESLDAEYLRGSLVSPAPGFVKACAYALDDSNNLVIELCRRVVKDDAESALA